MSLPLAPTAPTDFDFIIGDWRVAHRRLNARLAGCTEWSEFGGHSTTRTILGGFGNLEDSLIAFPGGAFRAVAMRSYCAAARSWSIWWLDGRNPTMLDTPVVGQFNDGVGVFYAEDALDGRPIQIRFIWTARADEPPRWEQAFSADRGQSWETNWVMTFHRLPPAPSEERTATEQH